MACRKDEPFLTEPCGIDSTMDFSFDGKRIGILWNNTLVDQSLLHTQHSFILELMGRSYEFLCVVSKDLSLVFIWT